MSPAHIQNPVKKTVICQYFRTQKINYVCLLLIFLAFKDDNHNTLPVVEDS